MTLRSVEEVIRALASAQVRFIVVGGLAVNAHGYLRFTKDLDLVIRLVPDNVRATFAALSTLGYRPIVPITAEQFADDSLRGRMIHEKGMEVLQLYSDEHRETPIDLFVHEPFAFDDEYERALVKELPNAGPVRFVSIETLIRMKEAVARPEDLLDAKYLRELLDHG